MATIAVDAMTFIKTVHVGDVRCVFSRITKCGRSSMAIQLEAWASRDRIGERVKVTQGVFTFVAIDADGRTRPLP